MTALSQVVLDDLTKPRCHPAAVCWAAENLEGEFSGMDYS